MYKKPKSVPTLKSTVKSSYVGVDEDASDVATGVTDNNCGFLHQIMRLIFLKLKLKTFLLTR